MTWVLSKHPGRKWNGASLFVIARMHAQRTLYADWAREK
jgi:hypothetical protein